jgi:hypothetical protein
MDHMGEVEAGEEGLGKLRPPASTDSVRKEGTEAGGEDTEGHGGLR